MAVVTDLVTTAETVRVGDTERTYLVVHRSDSSERAPLILAFHGSNQTGSVLRQFSEPRFDLLASRFGAVVVYLDGYSRHWNDARSSIDFATRRKGYDDVAFTLAVISQLEQRRVIDPSRVYAIGFSNGGQLVIRLAHEVPDRLAGIAVISATQPAPENFAPDADLRVGLPTLLVHGTKDPLVTYAGGMASMFGIRPRGLGLSAADSAAYFARRNGIDSAPVVTGEVDSAGMRVERAHFSQGGKPPVRLITIVGGGHVVPGDKPGPRIMGRTSTLHTAEEIAAFFGLTQTVSNHE